jgi:hypothetical protein
MGYSIRSIRVRVRWLAMRWKKWWGGWGCLTIRIIWNMVIWLFNFLLPCPRKINLRRNKLTSLLFCYQGKLIRDRLMTIIRCFKILTWRIVIRMKRVGRNLLINMMKKLNMKGYHVFTEGLICFGNIFQNYFFSYLSSILTFLRNWIILLLTYYK